MTTIVAREEYGRVVFAFDDRVSSGSDYSDGWVTKVFECGELIVGSAGDLRFLQLIRYVDLPQPDEGEWDYDRFVTEVFIPAVLELADEDSEFKLLLAVGGRIYEIDSYGAWVRDRDGLYSIGSGYKYAIGAMLMGADVEQAVKVASMRDSGTSSFVTVIEKEVQG